MAETKKLDKLLCIERAATTVHSVFVVNRYLKHEDIACRAPTIYNTALIASIRASE